MLRVGAWLAAGGPAVPPASAAVQMRVEYFEDDAARVPRTQPSAARRACLSVVAHADGPQSAPERVWLDDVTVERIPPSAVREARAAPRPSEAVPRRAAPPGPL
jgi:hypothetical protein